MSLRILMVEKDATTSDLLVPSLERKGYHVAVVRSQRQALVQIRRLYPDLLVIDIASFGSKGYQVNEAIRARLDGVPTILLLQEGHESAGATAQAFMTPPFTTRKLLYRVKKVGATQSRREIQAGPLSLDPDTRILRKGDKAMHLRPKEAQLLTLFIENQGRVLSREEIMKKVWETDFMGDTRTLSVHVRWLRVKMEGDPGSPRFLRTVRGVGYRFAVPDDE